MFQYLKKMSELEITTLANKLVDIYLYKEEITNLQIR